MKFLKCTERGKYGYQSDRSPETSNGMYTGWAGGWICIRVSMPDVLPEGGSADSVDRRALLESAVAGFVLVLRIETLRIRLLIFLNPAQKT